MYLRRKKTLGSHANTICSYLKQHSQPQVEENLQDEEASEANFYTYIIVCCWRKLYRRIVHWSALGLIFNLANIDAESLRHISSPDDDVEPDGALGRFFYSDQSLTSHETLMQYPCAVTEHNPCPLPDLERLRRAAIEFNGKGIYRKSTIEDFHYFCVRLLVGYAVALAKLSESMKAGSSWDEVKKHIDAIIPISRSLLVIAHSRTLKHHLCALSSSRGLLEMPSINLMETYVKYALKCKIIRQNSRVNHKVEDKIMAAAAIPSSGASDSRDNENQDPDGDGGTGDFLQDDSEQGEEAVEIARSATLSKGELGEAFSLWFKTFVSHFAAKRALEKQATQTTFLGRNIAIHPLGMRRSSPYVGTWGDITSLIHDIMDSKAPAVISLLECHIMAYTQAGDKGSYHKIYELFRLLRCGDEATDSSRTKAQFHSLFHGCLHCEAILAAIALYYRKLGIPDTPENRELLSICKVSSMLSMPFPTSN